MFPLRLSLLKVLLQYLQKYDYTNFEVSKKQYLNNTTFQVAYSGSTRIFCWFFQVNLDVNTGLPTDVLQEGTIKWFKSKNCEDDVTTVTQILERKPPKVKKSQTICIHLYCMYITIVQGGKGPQTPLHSLNYKHLRKYAHIALKYHQCQTPVPNFMNLG